MSIPETIEILDDIIRHLRYMCYDFHPRQINDLGLLASLRGLVDRVSDRSGMLCTLQCHRELPTFPDDLSLHIFRIIQESLTNTEKYSGASLVSVVIEAPSTNRLRFTVHDNGCGFNTGGHERTVYSGSGLASTKERAALINSYLPARLKIESKPGAGTTLTLELILDRGQFNDNRE